MYKKV